MYPDKPKYYIVDPLVAVNTDSVANSALRQLWGEYAAQAKVSIPLTIFDEASKHARANGAFSFTRFIDEVKKAGFPLFDEKYVVDHLQKALDLTLPTSLRETGLRALQENGTVVFLSHEGEGAADKLMSDSVMKLLEKRFAKPSGIAETVNESEWAMRIAKDRVAAVTFVKQDEGKTRYSTTMELNATGLENAHTKRGEAADITFVTSRYADASDLAKITGKRDEHKRPEVSLVTPNPLPLPHKGIRDVRKLEDVVPLQQRREGIMHRLESVGGMLR
jgi:hypothetical protein